MVRVVLLPFHSTPPNIQLDGSNRDSTDEALDNAMSKASAAAGLLIKLGNTLKDADVDRREVIQKVRNALSGACTRVHRSYAWLITATLMVSPEYW